MLPPKEDRALSPFGHNLPIALNVSDCRDPRKRESAQPMPFVLQAHFLPRLADPEMLAGATCIVLDALRATTTIAHALAAGAERVLPMQEVSEAMSAAAALPKSSYLLGGERSGVRIPGFDLGNSPREYQPERVAGRTLVFTTTNGTRAMLHCHRARAVLLAAFVNRSAVASRLIDDDNVHLVCAGTNGEITREDVLAAGAIIDLASRERADAELNDQATLARDAWRSVVAGIDPCQTELLSARLRRTLRDTQGGKNLIALGLETDIDDAGSLDAVAVVPETLPPVWQFRARRHSSQERMP